MRFWPMIERFLHHASDAHVDTVGRCIYCVDVVAEGLSKEHVMPFGMGGGIILRDASCARHKAAIDPFENHVVQKQFGPVRHMHGMPSRNDRPTYYPGAVKRNGLVRKEDVPLEYFPDILVLPVFTKPPTILQAGKPCLVSLTEVRNYHNKDANAAKLVAYGAEEIIVVPEFRPDYFIRWLAKVAHGVAVANYGMEFTPLLLDLIEDGDVGGAGYLIGSQVRDMPAPAAAAQHSVRSDVLYLANSDADGMVVVHVQLFAAEKTPIYSVVVGRPTAALSAKLKLEPLETA